MTWEATTNKYSEEKIKNLPILSEFPGKLLEIS